MITRTEAVTGKIGMVGETNGTAAGKGETAQEITETLARAPDITKIPTYCITPAC